MNELHECPLTELSRGQLVARAEWRTLCFALEGRQATSLLASGCDKYSLARTYLVYRDDHRAVADRVDRAIERGDFHFFVERNIPTPIINTALARQMLRGWSAAVASKLARIEVMFSCHFGEELEEFVVTTAHADRIQATPTRDNANAVTLLEHGKSGRTPSLLVGDGRLARL